MQAARRGRRHQSGVAAFMSETTPGVAQPFSVYEDARRRHWDQVTIKTDPYRGWGGYYHRRLEEVYRFHIPPGRRVLEIGCGNGDLLAAVKPSLGVGVDFSGEMIARARRKHPELKFNIGRASCRVRAVISLLR